MTEPTRGRPMDAERDKRIVQATLQLMGDRGFEALSIEAVAKLAGVSKATVYRRHTNKLELVIDALNRGLPNSQMPDSGNAFDDFRHMAQTIRAFAMNDRTRRMMGCMMVERGRHPEVAEAVLKRIVLPRRAEGKKVLDRAVVQDRLPADAPMPLMMDLVFGCMVMRHGRGETMNEAEVDQLVEVIWRGVGGKP